ncbi:MAG: hypothetical protein CML68_18855 [Rhodobacteraceae bacterium]|nr:hypothetical protein [Paracoccaceae bacterium]
MTPPDDYSDALADTEQSSSEGFAPEFDGGDSSVKRVPDTPMALIDLGAAKIGIDVGDLREVMPAPEPLQPFQSSAPGVVGCVALRGQVVPVVDIAPMIGLPSCDQESGGVIVIIGNNELVYGVLARAALQIVQADRCVPQSICRDDAALIDRLLARLVLVNDEAIGVLDAQALPQLGVPRSRTVRHRDKAVMRDETENYLLFETDGTRFCLPLANIQATLPDAPIDRTVLSAGPSEGGVIHHGIERSLLNLARFLGMSSDTQLVPRASTILLSRPDAAPLALRADRVSDILSLRRADIAEMPSLLSSAPEMFVGVYMGADGGENYVLDGESLLAEPTLSAFGSLEHSVSLERSDRSKTNSSDITAENSMELALLVVAGAGCALEVEAVEEIVSADPAVAQRASGGNCYLGNITSRRGVLIPTFALASVLGQSVGHGSTLRAIVIIRRAGEQIGLLVDEICAFERMVVMSDGKDGGKKILQRRKGEDRTLWQVVQPQDLILNV